VEILNNEKSSIGEEMTGKGDRPRKIKDRKRFNDNWDKIFGNKKDKSKKEKK
jgi:hypothetical protein